VVTHERSGLLAREGDTRTLAANLLRLLRDDRLWADLSEFGCIDMANRFDIVKQTAQLEEIYRQTISNETNDRKAVTQTLMAET